MFLKTILVTCIVIGLANADSSPVFLSGSNSAAKPSLQTVEQNEFANEIAPLLKDSMVVAFLEPNLESLDFLCTNPDTGKSCYRQLKDVSPKTYYASVENPIEALRNVTEKHEFATIDEKGNFDTAVAYEAGKVVFITLETSDDAERWLNLEKHDAFMELVISKLSKSGKITALYMSTPSTIAQRRVRRATNAGKGGFIFREGDQFLLFFTDFLYAESSSKRLTSIKMEHMTITNSSNTNFAVELAPAGGGNKLTFNIVLKGGYFMMENLAYGTQEFHVFPAVESPINFSYFCGNRTFNSVSTIKEPSDARIVWSGLQFQAPFGHTKNEKFVFGDAWHCVGFFTPGILAGLFVSVLLLTILSVGICWIMDINTMDRFDDPKGKTITISATD